MSMAGNYQVAAGNTCTYYITIMTSIMNLKVEIFSWKWKDQIQHWNLVEQQPQPPQPRWKFYYEDILKIFCT